MTPGVVDLKTAAAYLGQSTRTLHRRLARGEHIPGLMPRKGREAWQFSMPMLRKFVEGGYAAPYLVNRRSA